MGNGLRFPGAWACSALFLAALPSVASGQEQGDSIRPTSYQAEWMYEGSYGLMVHYLITPEGSTPEARTEAFNRVVNGFDIDAFMKQFEKSGADWLFFTIGQNTGYYCSPNTFLDRAAPGHTSDRDLVLEIARRVKELGKWFVAYLPAEVAQQSDEIRHAFAWQDGDKTEYLNRYLDFVKDYALSYGPLCDGWWFDGCYDGIHKGTWDWKRWIDAVREGNWQSAVAFNDGSFCVGKLGPLTPLETFLAGEVHLLEDSQIRTDFLATGKEVYKTPEGHLRLQGQEPKFYMPQSRCVDGVQWHALVPIDSSFAAPAVPNQHYADEDLFLFVLNCRAVGGAVTLNVPIDPKGSIPDETVAQLARLNREIRNQIANSDQRNVFFKDCGTRPDELRDVQPFYLLSAFRRALVKGQWELALSMCSKDEQAMARTYPSPQAFLEDKIPIDLMLSFKHYLACNYATETFTLCLQIIDDKDGRDYWGFFIHRKEGLFVIDFLPMSASDYLSAAQSAKEYRNACRSRVEEEYGKAAEELQLKLVLNKTIITAGEAIPCRIVAANDGDKDFLIGARQLFRCSFEIIDADGKNVASPRPKAPRMQTCLIGMEAQKLAAGSSVVALDYKDLAEDHPALRTPGEYAITFRGSLLSPWVETPVEREKALPLQDRYLDTSRLSDPKYRSYAHICFEQALSLTNTVKITVRPAH